MFIYMKTYKSLSMNTICNPLYSSILDQSSNSRPHFVNYIWMPSTSLITHKVETEVCL